jgi:hypothetical protein
VRTNEAEKRNKNAYLVQRRRDIREKGLIAVALANGHKVPECFICGARDSPQNPLELNHIKYFSDSVLKGHSAERAEEAQRRPKDFSLLCRNHHLEIDARKMGKEGFHPDANIGSEVRASEVIRRSRTLTDLRKENCRKEIVITKLLEEKRQLREQRDSAVALAKEYKATLEELTK